MKKLHLILALALTIGFTTSSFAEEKNEANASNKDAAKVEAATPTNNVSAAKANSGPYYWYDANTGLLIAGGPTQSAGCPDGDVPCAYGYDVSNFPTTPPPNEQPTEIDPDETERTNLP